MSAHNPLESDDEAFASQNDLDQLNEGSGSGPKNIRGGDSTGAIDNTAVATPKPPESLLGAAAAKNARTATPTFTDLHDTLVRRISGHDTVLKQLAFVCDPRWRAGCHGVAERVLIIGQTGSGKSHLLATLADCAGLPCVTVDASQLSESGWQGMQPADVMTQLYDAVGQSLPRLVAGEVILVLDEIDKLCPRNRRDPLSVSVRRGRQQSLLALLGGVTPVRFNTINALQQSVSLSARTDRILIICAGSFPGLSVADAEGPTDSALTRYGMIPEFAARLTMRLTLSSRTPKELVAMWRAPGGVVCDSEYAASSLGIRLTVTDGALAVVAHAVAAGVDGLTPRGGSGIIMRVVRAALIRALETGPRDSPFVTVTPDDVIVRPLPGTPQATRW